MRDSCPYNAQPPTSRWRDAVARVAAAVDPTLPASFRLDRNMALASAGSCFAQHVRNQLVRAGYNYLVTEPGLPELSDDQRADRSYGVFPARFGNVYTTVQLLQLFERAYGRFRPSEDYWREGDGFIDPFRPTIEPGGFASLAALRRDRERHLAATREMFETVDVFVFTLGLTEAWRSRGDGAVFPLCPGCPVGTFDAERHEFVNLGVSETTEALFAFIAGFAAVNPNARIILTVSPVPLAATMSRQHVLQATTYSKSVLRVAAEQARERFAQVSYFPAYEIITATARAHEFFAGDRRTVTPAGVDRVMALFFQCYAGDQPAAEAAAGGSSPSQAPFDDVVCDEETVLRVLRRSS